MHGFNFVSQYVNPSLFHPTLFSVLALNSRHVLLELSILTFLQIASPGLLSMCFKTSSKIEWQLGTLIEPFSISHQT